MDMTEKTIKSEYRFNGKILNLRVDEVSLPNGHTSSREIVEHNGGVGIAALTDTDKIVLVRQYRHPYKKVIYEIPAGKLEKGEQPLVCGMRELKEETGYTADKWEDIGCVYPSPGYTEEIIYIFLATSIHPGKESPDDDEFVETVKIPLDDAVDMVFRGEIPDSKTQVAILKAAELKRRGVI